MAGLALLLLLGLFYIFGAASDLTSLAAGNLPADHQGTFAKLAGTTFSQAKSAAPGIASYITVAERGYAIHELTFALLFIVLIAILWVPKTCATWADALRSAVGLVQCSALAGPALAWPEVG